MAGRYSGKTYSRKKPNACQPISYGDVHKDSFPLEVNREGEQLQRKCLSDSRIPSSSSKSDSNAGADVFPSQESYDLQCSSSSTCSDGHNFGHKAICSGTSSQQASTLTCLKKAKCSDQDTPMVGSSSNPVSNLSTGAGLATSLTTTTAFEGEPTTQELSKKDGSQFPQQSQTSLLCSKGIGEDYGNELNIDVGQKFAHSLQKDMKSCEDDESTDLSGYHTTIKRSSFFSAEQREKRQKKRGMGRTQKEMYMSYLKSSWNEDADEVEFKKPKVPMSTGEHVNPQGLITTGRHVMESQTPIQAPVNTLRKRGSSSYDASTSKPVKVVHRTNLPHKIGAPLTTSLMVDPGHKQLFTVVRNAKEAYECREQGESQQFDDDLEYLLAGLNSTSSVSTRCLSCVSLASKCATSTFRMHLRARGKIPIIFSSLQDACQSHRLALCTAALMFMLSRDRLHMDINPDCLHLMVRILDCVSVLPMDNSSGHESYETNRLEGDNGLDLEACEVKEYASLSNKISTICQPLWKSHGRCCDSEWEVSASFLAMESLLSLTSHKAGDWLKESLRDSGGIDRIVTAVLAVTDNINLAEGPTPAQMDKFSRLIRSLRILESVTQQHPENQQYLLSIKNASLILSLCRVLSMCEGKLADVDVGDTANLSTIQLLLSVLRLLFLLTNENERGSGLIGSQAGLLEDVLSCLFQAPRKLPQDHQYEVHLISLCLLLNLMEQSKANRTLLMGSNTTYYAPANAPCTIMFIPAINALVKLFLLRNAAAEKIEKESMSSDTAKGEEERLARNRKEVPDSDHGDESVNDILRKACCHMEDSVVAFHVSLLLGSVMQRNEEYATIVKSLMPGGQSLLPLITTLTKFQKFLQMADLNDVVDNKSISKILRELQTLDGSCVSAAAE